MDSDIQKFIETGLAGIAVIIALISIVGAFRSGALTRIRLGNLEISGQEASKIRSSIEKTIKEGDNVPFEVEQLTNYYSQILSQSKISFWFSLVFASLGFVAILIAAFFYNDANTSNMVAQFIAGLIMEAVASLFFVQSRNAHKSMGEFFDKLRKDRLYMESRNLCDDISNSSAQDALKLNLSLHYAGVSNAETIAKQISDTTLVSQPNNAINPDS